MPAQDAARAWDAVRHSAEIQYAPIPAPKIQEPPGWFKALVKFLHDLFEPLGKALGLSWPVLQWLLLALLAGAVLLVLWRLLSPWLRRPHKPAPEDIPWTPDRGEALALLEDADRLAAAGRFDEATHLLLRRSVQQIAGTRPDWVHPASTAREIASIAALPEAARGAFAAISLRVERSLFALRSLDAADWQAAREAYATFALQRLAAESAG